VRKGGDSVRTEKKRERERERERERDRARERQSERGNRDNGFNTEQRSSRSYTEGARYRSDFGVRRWRRPRSGRLEGVSSISGEHKHAVEPKLVLVFPGDRTHTLARAKRAPSVGPVESDGPINSV
jgi:hypothetical protein